MIHHKRASNAELYAFFDVGLKDPLKKQSICRWPTMPWRSCIAAVMSRNAFPCHDVIMQRKVKRELVNRSLVLIWINKKYCQASNISIPKSPKLNVSRPTLQLPCTIHRSKVLSQGWMSCWSSADRRSDDKVRLILEIWRYVPFWQDFLIHHITKWTDLYGDGLMQDSGNHSALAMRLALACTKLLHGVACSRDTPPKRIWS